MLTVLFPVSFDLRTVEVDPLWLGVSSVEDVVHAGIETSEDFIRNEIVVINESDREAVGFGWQPDWEINYFIECWLGCPSHSQSFLFDIPELG